MIRILLPLLVLLAAAPATAAERRYTITDFDRVQVEGPFKVTLKTGGSTAAFASGSSGALDRLSIDVQGRTLRIRQNRSAWGGYPGEAIGPLLIQVATPTLRAVSVGGSGTLAIDRAKSMRFDVALSGSGRIDVGALEADFLNIGLLGSGTVAISGKAKSLRAAIQGSGNFEGSALSVEDAQIGSDTTGLVGVAVRRAVNVTSTGQGDTRIIGSPSCTVKQTGSGQVFCGKSDQGQR